MDGFDKARVAAAFGSGPVVLEEQDLGVGLPLVGVVTAMAVVTPGQRGS